MASSSAPVIEFPSPGAELAYTTPAPGPLVVQSPEEYTATAEHLKTIKTFQRRVADWFAPLKRKAQDAHRALCEEERKILQPSVDDVFRINRALVTYTTEQERLRRQEQLELQRQERLRQEEQRLEQAAALERESAETGDPSFLDAAHHLLDAPIAVAPVQTLTAPTPKVDGLSYRETYRANVLDLMTLVKEVAAGRQPLGLVCANQTALDGLARSLKSSFAVPGVQLVVDKTPVARTR